MTRHLRVRRGRLQTPIHHYQHPASGRTITLIATIHVGEPTYYADLLTVITGCQQEGAIVHAEGSRLQPDPEDLTPQERDTFTAMRHLQMLDQQRITEWGWIGQREGLGYPPDWQLTDISPLDVIRRTGTDLILRRTHGAIRIRTWDPQDTRAPHRFRLQTGLMLRATASPLVPQRPKPTDEVILHQRNALALDALWATDQNTVLIWGVKHAPGLHTAICTNVYTLTRTTWHTACRIPSIRRALTHLIHPRTPATIPVQADPPGQPTHDQATNNTTTTTTTADPVPAREPA